MPARSPNAVPPPHFSIGSNRASMDPKALMRIKDLQLRAKVIVDGFYNGLHRSPLHGFSSEFSEYRQYAPGDDTRFIDWRLFARSDRYYIKRFEDETNRRCYLIVDLSRSMSYTSDEYSKADYARTLAATLAYYLNLQRDSVGLLTFDEQVREFIAARSRGGHLHQLMMALDRSEAGEATDLSLPLQQLATLVKKRGLIVFISDLLAPIDSLRRDLAYLRTRGHEVLLLRVLDRNEVEFSLEDAAVMVDVESNRRLYIDPQAIRQEYIKRFQAHAAEIEEAAMALGIDYVQLLTDEPLEIALFELFQSQLRGGRKIHRRQGNVALAGGGS